MNEPTTVSRLVDAATVFAMELAQPGLVGRDQFGMLDRPTALAELASIAGHRPELLQRVRRFIDGLDVTGVDELLVAAAHWAAFSGDD